MNGDLLFKILVDTAILTTKIVTVLSISQNASVFLGNYVINEDNNYDGNIMADADYVKRVYDEIPKGEITFYGGTDLLPYINKLRLYFFENDLKVGIDNLNNISVKRKHLLGLLGIKGFYDSNKNEMCYASSKAVGHEVLHMFSTMYDEIVAIYDSKNKIILSGFSQTKGSVSIGKGINEGYTELLASRIFNKNGKVNCYHKEVKIARLLELFFDDSKDMSNMYFSCDLPGLIHHLEAFASRDEIMNFIQDVDCLYRYERSAIGPIPTIKSVQAQLTLYDWFTKTNKDPKKLKKFEKIINEDNITSLIIKRKKMKLVTESKYSTQLEDNQKIKRKDR